MKNKTLEEIVMSQRTKGLHDFGSPAVDGWQIRKHHLPRESLYASVIVWGDFPDESENRKFIFFILIHYMIS